MSWSAPSSAHLPAVNASTDDMDADSDHVWSLSEIQTDEDFQKAFDQLNEITSRGANDAVFNQQPSAQSLDQSLTMQDLQLLADLTQPASSPPAVSPQSLGIQKMPEIIHWKDYKEALAKQEKQHQCSTLAGKVSRFKNPILMTDVPDPQCQSKRTSRDWEVGYHLTSQEGTEGIFLCISEADPGPNPAQVWQEREWHLYLATHDRDPLDQTATFDEAHPGSYTLTAHKWAFVARPQVKREKLSSGQVLQCPFHGSSGMSPQTSPTGGATTPPCLSSCSTVTVIQWPKIALSDSKGDHQEKKDEKKRKNPIPCAEPRHLHAFVLVGTHPSRPTFYSGQASFCRGQRDVWKAKPNNSRKSCVDLTDIGGTDGSERQTSEHVLENRPQKRPRDSDVGRSCQAGVTSTGDQPEVAGTIAGPSNAITSSLPIGPQSTPRSSSSSFPPVISDTITTVDNDGQASVAGGADFGGFSISLGQFQQRPFLVAIIHGLARLYTDGSSHLRLDETHDIDIPGAHQAVWKYSVGVGEGQQLLTLETQQLLQVLLDRIHIHTRELHKPHSLQASTIVPYKGDIHCDTVRFNSVSGDVPETKLLRLNDKPLNRKRPRDVLHTLARVAYLTHILRDLFPLQTVPRISPSQQVKDDARKCMESDILEEYFREVHRLQPSMHSADISPVERNRFWRFVDIEYCDYVQYWARLGDFKEAFRRLEVLISNEDIFEATRRPGDKILPSLLGFDRVMSMDPVAWLASDLGRTSLN